MKVMRRNLPSPFGWPHADRASSRIVTNLHSAGPARPHEALQSPIARKLQQCSKPLGGSSPRILPASVQKRTFTYAPVLRNSPTDCWTLAMCKKQSEDSHGVVLLLSSSICMICMRHQSLLLIASDKFVDHPFQNFLLWLDYPMGPFCS